MKTYYDMLNLREDADKRDIKRAFHRLAKRLHPDVSKDGRMFVEVLGAYETLIDDGRRAAYDDSLARAERGGAPFARHAAIPPRGDHGARVRPAAYRLVPKSRVTFALSLRDVVRHGHPRREALMCVLPRTAVGYHASVRLTRQELAGGSVVEVDVPAHVVCPVCGGDRIHCNLCSFRGYVLKAVSVPVPIPRNLSDGAVFAFPLRDVKTRHYAYFKVDTLYLKVCVLQEAIR